MQATEKETKKEIKIVTDWSKIINNNNDMNKSTNTIKPITTITKTHVDIKDNTQESDDVFTLSNVLSTEECQNIIREAEKHGFGLTNCNQSCRGCLRLTTTDIEFSTLLFNRIKQYLPEIIIINNSESNNAETWKISNLNERIRIAKYYPSTRFDIHYDEGDEKSENERAFYTFNLYLNGNFENGETRFFDKHNRHNVTASVKGTDGLCLIFRQLPYKEFAHDGDVVTNGIKYLLRSDIMYTRQNN